jgi:hypothetical protein
MGQGGTPLMYVYQTASSPRKKLNAICLEATPFTASGILTYSRALRWTSLLDLGFDQKELDEIWNKSLKEEFDVRERA